MKIEKAVMLILLVAILILSILTLIKVDKNNKEGFKTRTTFSCIDVDTGSDGDGYMCGDWYRQAKTGVCTNVDGDKIDCQSAIECCKNICPDKLDEDGYCIDRNN